jgi:putative toxin-antitoxin system antitoxin component (TIGR02293 family)
MGQSAAIPVVSPPPFTFDWREIERGLPLSTLEEFSVYSGIAVKDLLEVVIPARTLKHRRQRQEPLNLDESDRLARVARMYELAVKVYGDREDGRKWLCGKKSRFDGKTALEMLWTETGERAVEEYLYQIDEGVFA